jgi:predicted transcriptional regulator
MTGFDKLASETGLTTQKVRTSLNRLKSTNEITIKSNSQGTIIQIVNYEKYQVATDEQQTNNKPITNDQQTNNKQITTNKNDNNVNNEKNDKEDDFDFEKALVDYGFQPMLVKDWLKVRRKKKATNSETAFNAFIKVIKRTEGKVDKNLVMSKCVEKDWRGLEYSWLENIGMVEKWQSPA